MTRLVPSPSRLDLRLNAFRTESGLGGTAGIDGVIELAFLKRFNPVLEIVTTIGALAMQDAEHCDGHGGSRNATSAQCSECLSEEIQPGTGQWQMKSKYVTVLFIRVQGLCGKASNNQSF